MVTAMNSISAAQTTDGVKNLKKRINHFLDYAITHPNAKIEYVASALHLWAHSDASYLCESKARSRAGGVAFLSDAPKFPILPDDPPPTPNHAVIVVCKIIDAVMSSTQEAETGAGFMTARTLIPARITLEELGHPQGPTPLQFDNQCAKGILTDEIKQKCSKAMDMRFYWLRDRVRQLQFKIYWKLGVCNDGDYVTKHHPTKHHIAVRHKYVANSTTNITKTFQIRHDLNPTYENKIQKFKILVRRK